MTSEDWLMISLKERIKENPIKFFIIILIGIFIFLSISFVITLGISYNPTINVVSSFFNKTNISTTLDFFISSPVNNSTSQGNISASSSSNGPLYNNTLNFDSISSIIALLGSFGVISYLFYSIKEGTLSKTDNKKLFYGYLGFLGIIIIFIAIVIASLIQGKFPIGKQFEIISLIVFLFFTLLIAALFKEVNDEIEENYKNRSKLIEFLEVQNSDAVIWQPIDNFARLIVLHNDFFSIYVFVLICLIPVLGILIGLNLLSIIFFEIMIFTIFSGFCRLIRLCDENSEITLNRQPYSWQDSYFSENLSKVFFLTSYDDYYFKILTKKGYISILKNEVITIHDNEVIIFKGKENLSPLNIWIKRMVRFVLSSIIAYIFYLILLFFIIYIGIFIYPDLQQITPENLSLLLVTIQGISIASIFCIIGLCRKRFDKWLEAQVDWFIKPQDLENN